MPGQLPKDPIQKCPVLALVFCLALLKFLILFAHRVLCVHFALGAMT